MKTMDFLKNNEIRKFIHGLFSGFGLVLDPNEATGKLPLVQVEKWLSGDISPLCTDDLIILKNDLLQDREDLPLYKFFRLGGKKGETLGTKPLVVRDPDFEFNEKSLRLMRQDNEESGNNYASLVASKYMLPLETQSEQIFLDEKFDWEAYISLNAYNVPLPLITREESLFFNDEEEHYEVCNGDGQFREKAICEHRNCICDFYRVISPKVKVGGKEKKKEKKRKKISSRRINMELDDIKDEIRLINKLSGKRISKNIRVFPEDLKKICLRVDLVQGLIKDYFKFDKNLSLKKNKLKKKKKKRKINTKLLLPSFIRKLLNTSKRFVQLSTFNHYCKYYNFCFNAINVNLAYEVDIDRQLFFESHQMTDGPIKFNIKKKMCDPFEALLNECSDIQENIKKINKKIKKEERRNVKSSLRRQKMKIIENLQGVTRFDFLGLKISSFMKLGFKTIHGLLFSHYMGKKNLFINPSSTEELVDNHKKLMTRTPEIHSKDLEGIRLHVRKLFSHFNYTVNEGLIMPQSTYRYRDEDIVLHDFLVDGSSELQEDYLHFLRTDELKGTWSELARDFFSNSTHDHSVKLVPDKGKTRVITTNHPATFLMKNLQNCVQRYLSKKRIFKYTGAQVADRVVVGNTDNRDLSILSGDYENSTDFIPQQVTYCIWNEILKKVPGWYQNLKRLVLKSLSNEQLFYPDGSSVMKTSGQLMGSLTSFPALCILNDYVSSKAHIDFKKINGDDLLAFSDQARKDAWKHESIKAGLSINESKSHLNRYAGTFNSQLLMREGNNFQRIPHFQVSKLKSGSLRDCSGKSLYNRLNHVYEKGFGRAWIRYHNKVDLFSGDLYDESDLSIIKEKFPSYVSNYNYFVQEDLLNIAQVGGMSKFYYTDDVEKTVSLNWQNKIEEQKPFSVGNGVAISLMDLEDEEGYLSLKRLYTCRSFFST